ncbi:MAG: hypothetical protein M3Y55_00930 [Pseudomonadota bacterium]|nr:hypothetical protein [Pseudomonadota bacterium]
MCARRGHKLIGNLQKAMKAGNDAIKALMLEIDRNLRRVDTCKAEMTKLSKEVDEIYKIRTSSKFTESACNVCWTTRCQWPRTRWPAR